MTATNLQQTRTGGGIAAFSMKNSLVSWMITIILLFGGILHFFELGQLEDPNFTIKNSVIVTLYPGASAQQVEEEVTHVLESALQNMKQVDYIASWSSNGFSQIDFRIPKTVTPENVQQVWDDMRRKISDVQHLLPKGASTPMINDDFGDVYGMMLQIKGDGHNLGKIKEYADYLKREILIVDGVGKVAISGEAQEQIFIEIDRAKVANQGITVDAISLALANQNVVSNAGDIHIGEEMVRFSPTGEYQTIEDLKNTVLSPLGSSNLVYLSDVANVYKGFKDKPTKVISLNGQEAISFGISFAPGVNVVTVGKRVQERLTELEEMRPIGIDYEFVYNQPAQVDKSVKGFLGNLLEACVIIFFVLLFTMGRKAGLLISFILVVTISGTFILMEMKGIQLQRISLGALIIALGMLIDNAIVIVEGLIIGMEKGNSKWDSMIAIVKQTQYPLLIATVIAVLAFAPIGLSPDSTGEIVGSLFWVLNFSLFLSWVTAVTITPFFCDLLYKDGEFDGHDEQEHDPYGGIVFRSFKSMLNVCMRFPWIFTIVMILALVVSAKSFKLVKPEFFPASTVKQFQIDVWDGYGTDIRTMEDKVKAIENYLLEMEKVTQATSAVGGGHVRFMLAYAPEKHFDNYANILVMVETPDDVVPTIATIKKEAVERFPELTLNLKRFSVGPQPKGAVEVRITGADPLVLRQLSEKAKTIMRATPGTEAVRDDWMARSKVIRPLYNEINGRRLGISKKQLDEAIRQNFSGTTIGLYKEGTKMMPVVSRPPESERLSLENLGQLNIFSPAKQDYVQISQVVDGFDITFEDAYILRRDRMRTITAMADYDVTKNITAATVRNEMVADFEQFETELPVGYTMAWGGKHEKSTDAKKNVLSTIPAGYLAMFLLTVLLFNSLKKGLVIWFVVPLSIIGVVGGLLLFDMPFTFMALLGALSLTGMMCRNGIVLIDQISIYQGKGAEDYKAIFDGAVSRVRPVSLTAIAAILGMIPLLQDAFFKAMAASMMVGLAVATFLILFAVPVFYMLMYRIKYRPLADIEAEGSLE
ncbi:efflux RND transporter permease subunit [Thalassotalea nanhaiensis]|uniref:Efflux RND transporter permease subunit n=1 Tax=Thalassotalea nanhaiensis TaxID=3065648 RepID=A0ABY9TDD7_9GAMM|nr:efflux RND transporter permease subunit [Colwelliaceae bacterium SQ345]